MSKWSTIYQSQIAEAPSLGEFIEKRLEYKKELIAIIKKYSWREKKLLEVGCGSGITTTFFGLIGYCAKGIDSDKDMVKLARTIANHQKSKASFKVDDLKTLNSIKEHFDVVFSNGVMEHFSNKDIISIINRHLEASDYVVVSVPSDYFSEKQKTYGDERFMGIKTWRSIFRRTQGIIVEEFSFNSTQSIKNKPQFIGFVLRTP